LEDNCKQLSSKIKGVSQFCRAGPLAFSPGRKRPGSGEDEARERPSPPWPPGFPKGYRRERALPAPGTSSARPSTAWPTRLPTILGHTH